ncbi:MAG: hypothetical protein QXD62_03750 [Candidatus Woesearchaeota archaeon]
MAGFSLFKEDKKRSNESSEELIRFRARAIIEIIGKPLEHVENMLQEIRTKIKKGFKTKSTRIFKPKEVEKGIFQGFLEIDIGFKNLEECVQFLHNFYPSSFEIYESEVVFSLSEINSLINETLTKMHEIGLALREISAQNSLLKEELSNQNNIIERLIENLIMVVLSKHEKLTYDEISRITGLRDFHQYLQKLVDEKKIYRDGMYYYR